VGARVIAFADPNVRVQEVFRQAWQLVFGTTRSLFLRFPRRQVSHPGLEKIFAVDSYDTTTIRQLADQMRECNADPAVGKAS
jgi:hypothetical protein